MSSFSPHQATCNSIKNITKSPQPDHTRRRCAYYLQMTDRYELSKNSEFNVYADSIAAARVFALTSPNPISTMPPIPPTPPGKQTSSPPPPPPHPSPPKLSRRLKLTLFPLGTPTSPKEHKDREIPLTQHPQT